MTFIRALRNQWNRLSDSTHQPPINDPLDSLRLHGLSPEDRIAQERVLSSLARSAEASYADLSKLTLRACADARRDYMRGHSSAYSPEVDVPPSQHDQYINRHIELDLLGTPMSDRIRDERSTMWFEDRLARQAAEKEAERRCSRIAAVNREEHKEARRAQMTPQKLGG